MAFLTDKFHMKILLTLYLRRLLLEVHIIKKHLKNSNMKKNTLVPANAMAADINTGARSTSNPLGNEEKDHSGNGIPGGSGTVFMRI